MKTIIKLSESQLKNVINNLVKEQKVTPDDTNRWSSIGPGPGKMREVTIQRPVTLDGSLFANGVDVIDTNGTQFKKGVNLIRTASSINPKLTVTVTGGASSVGGARYDNKSLAKRRSTNFIKAIKPFFKNVTFIEGNPVVSVRKTQKNSPQANAEQFVKLSFTETSKIMNQDSPIDNTANWMRTGKGIDRPTTTPGMVTKCIDIPESKLGKVMECLRSNGIKIV